MGYSTAFEGILKFIKPLTPEQEVYLSTIVGNCEDPDDHQDWIKPEGDLSYIQFEIAPDKSGIQWDGGEKFYYAANAANLVILTMKARFPDFGLEGSLRAQGEEIGDIWDLVIVDGIAIERPCARPEDLITCPHCKELFRLNEAA